MLLTARIAPRAAAYYIKLHKYEHFPRFPRSGCTIISDMFNLINNLETYLGNIVLPLASA